MNLSSFPTIICLMLAVAGVAATQRCLAFVSPSIKTAATTTSSSCFRTSIRALRSTASSTGSSSTSTNTMVAGGSRYSRGDLSLDLRAFQTDLAVVQSHLKARRASAETMQAAEQIATLNTQRVALIQERDLFLNQRKEASATVGQLMRKQQELTAEQQEQLNQARLASNQASEGATKAETALEEYQTTMDTLLANIPNLLDDLVPDGDSEQQNEEVYKWGDVTALPKKLLWTDDFKPAWHDDVATGLQGYEVEAAVKISGARFVALSGGVAQLERAIAMFLLDLHTTQHGYREVSVPYIVGRSALEGTSQLPKFQEDLFAITPTSHTCNGEDAFLIPTAEVPVTNLHREQVLDESDLPLSYVALTPCFRAEAGSYGRDTKGLIRTHQFQKVELVKITTADTSDEQHELLTKHAEACLQALELPYRKVRLCSGDIGFAARHCYDLEVWLPGAKEYREISSCSNTGDFQARRMSMRYRPSPSATDDEAAAAGGKKKKQTAKKGKTQLCHTINGSGLAVGRTLVAVLENYQRPDGSVLIPHVLRPYMGAKEVLEPPTKK